MHYNNQSKQLKELRHIEEVFGTDLPTKTEWDLSNNAINSDNISEGLHKINRLPMIEILHLGYNNNINNNIILTKMLMRIEFSSLKELSLQKNHLYSLEFLTSSVCCPLLEFINLEDNLLHNIKPFSKSNLPELKTIKISMDKVSTGWEAFSRGNFLSLDKLEVKSFYSPFSCMFNSKIVYLIKIATPSYGENNYKELNVTRKHEKCMFPVTKLLKYRTKKEHPIDLMIVKEDGKEKEKEKEKEISKKKEN